MGTGYPEYFGDVEDRDEVYNNIIHCNITSTTMMTSLIVNQMAARGKGLIINIASMSAIGPMPLLAVYSASKVREGPKHGWNKSF